MPTESTSRALPEIIDPKDETCLPRITCPKASFRSDLFDVNQPFTDNLNAMVSLNLLISIYSILGLIKRWLIILFFLSSLPQTQTFLLETLIFPLMPWMLLTVRILILLQSLLKWTKISILSFLNQKGLAPRISWITAQEVPIKVRRTPCVDFV